MYCQNCGAKNTNDASYCFQCGSKLNNQQGSKNELRISNHGRIHKTSPISTGNIQRQRRNRNIFIWIAVIVISFVGIGIWYNDTHYNSTFKNNFMNGCENQGGSTSSCGCAYNVLSNNFSYSEAKSINANPSGSPYSQSYIRDVRSTC